MSENKDLVSNAQVINNYYENTNFNINLKIMQKFGYRISIFLIISFHMIAISCNVK